MFCVRAKGVEARQQQHQFEPMSRNEKITPFQNINFEEQVRLEKKPPAYINALAEEYLRLSFHGMRAKNTSFNVTLKYRF